ncbi:MAG: RHS repeat protein, partial [Actinobacteria bacterium]|nr:RHS repeat protein [Actinomycetota bacterium]
VTRFSYDNDGNQLSVTDPTGAVSSRTLDVRGREIASTDALGRVTRTEYDIGDRVVKVTDPAGAVTQTVYDALGRVIESIDPTGARAMSRYSPAGRLTTGVDPLENTTTYEYNDLGQLVTVADPLGNRTKTSYDADGNLVTTTSPTGMVTRFRYDPTGRQIEVRDPRDGIARTVYSPRGEVLEEQDPTGVRRRFAYDPAGNLIKAIDANNAVTTFTYDQRANRVSMTDQQGARSTYLYDLGDRLVNKIDPLGRATNFAYDLRGALTQTTDPSGHSETNTYDVAGQLLSRVFSDNTSVAYTYDLAGRRKQIADTTGVTRYTYDARGALTTLTHPDGKVVASSFDAAGNRVGLTYPDGTTASFTYDPTNRLIGMSHPQAGTAGYSLDVEGRLVKETLPDGSWRSYGYTKDLLTSFTQTTEKGKKRTSTTLGHDANGRVSTETTDNKTTRYTYDPAGQLVQSTGRGGTVGYSYDKVGNRTAMSTENRTTSFTYDAAGQLQQAKQGNKLSAYTYDPAGRLLTETTPQGSTTRTYNAQGLLASRVLDGNDDEDEDGPKSWAYTYNGDGALTKLVTTNPGDGEGDDEGPRVNEHHFTWDTTGVPEILTWSADGLNTDLFYGYGRALAQQGTTTTVFAMDAYGSTIAKNDNDSFAIARSFDPWGMPDQDDDEEGGADIGFGYRSELHLGDDIYLRARTYAPSTGRFTTQDPLSGVDGEVTVANPYPYAANDPLNKVDPLGLRPVSDGDLQVMGAQVMAPGKGSSYILASNSGGETTKGTVPYCDSLQKKDYKSFGAVSGSIFAVSQQPGSHTIHWNFQVGESSFRNRMGNQVTVDEVGRSKNARRFIDRNSGKDGHQNHGSVTEGGNKIVPERVYLITVLYVGIGPGVVVGSASVKCRCR